jgi:magnesium transporter
MATKHVRRASEKKGLPPGVAVYIGDTEPLDTTATFMEFDHFDHPKDLKLDAHLKAEISHISTKSGWLNISGLKNEQAIYDICHTLKIHPLEIEDILDTEQLSKIEFLPDRSIVIIKAPAMKNSVESVKFEQFSMILKDNLLITFQEINHDLLDHIKKYLSHSFMSPTELNASHLVYLLIDMIIDDHFEIVEKKGDELENIEETLMKKGETINSNTLYTLKRDMLHLRKNIMSLNSIVFSMIRKQPLFMTDLPEIYLKDLQEHLELILESIDIHRELSNNILEIYMSSVNNKINETMKFLTIFTAIFIPMSFIAGLYGMNFSHMPELNWEYGYYATLGMMFAIAGGLLVYFRRKKWI